MSCSSNPINIKNTKEICREDCSYSFQYNPNSSAIISNMGDYLEIQVDGKNTVKFNSIDVTVTDVRIYQPSFHLFGGKQTAAEVVIQHKNPMGDSLLVCIPVIAKDGRGASNSFFSKIIPNISNEDKSPQTVNVRQWSLNDVVPSSQFYYYVGSYPYKPCSGQVNIIVFGLNNTATINSSDLKTLKTLIDPISYTKAQTIGGASNKDVLLMKNPIGSQGPDTKDNSYYIFNDCEAITGMDDSGTPSVRASLIPDTSGFVPPWVVTMLISLLIIVIIGALAMFCFGNNQGPVDEGGAGGVTSAGTGTKK